MTAGNHPVVSASDSAVAHTGKGSGRTCQALALGSGRADDVEKPESRLRWCEARQGAVHRAAAASATSR